MISTVKNVLSRDPRFADADERILFNTVRAAALNLEPELIRLLLSEPSIKKYFFRSIDGTLVFDQTKFLKFIELREFLPKSYTAFRNKIGLYLSNISDVVLAFPFKDGVLEGGQTREDQKRNEIFYNEVIAPERIDCLLEPKVLIGAKRFSPERIEPTREFRADDNLIVKGNNLLALSSLLERFESRVKLIYIDPPYNTGSDSFGYNDRFNHSTWLVFMKNRLELARKFLRNDGAIFLQCDDSEGHYLKVLCDELFGRENFVSTVIWEKKYSPQNDAKWLSNSHDFILIYARNKNVWRPNLLPRTEAMNARYKNPDNDPRGPWKSGDLTSKTTAPGHSYCITAPSGRQFYPPKGRQWAPAYETFKQWLADNRISFGDDGDGVPRVKNFLSEVQQGSVSKTIWFRDEVGDNQEAKREIMKFDLDEIFSTPKPERLLERIIKLGSNEGDLVLDFYAGSGTTAAVAARLNRQFVTVEQMDYVESITVERIKQSGASFVFCRLAKLNQKFIDELQTPDADLKNIFERMLAAGYVDFEIDPSEARKKFDGLNASEQKIFMLELLDKNFLYVNRYALDDEEFAIDEADKAFTRSFYEGGGR